LTDQVLEAWRLPILFGVGVLGILLAWLVAEQARWFWPLLIGGAVFGSGPMLWGYALADEFFVYCVLGGALLRVLVTSAPGAPGPHTASTSLRRTVFGFFILYFTFQSIVGWIYLDDPRLARFVMFFPAIWLTSRVIESGRFPPPDRSQLCVILTASTILYLAIYVLFGAGIQTVTGVRWQDLQGELWVGTTVGAFPGLVALPAAWFLLMKGSPNQRLLGLLFVVADALVASFYDSRLALFGLAFILLFSLYRAKFTMLTIVLVVFAVGVVVPFTVLKERDFNEARTVLTSEVGDTVIGLVTGGRDSDIDRRTSPGVWTEIVFTEPVTAVVGSGFYTHRYRLLEPMLRARRELGLPPTAGDVVRPATFGAFLADTGLIGLTLFLANFAFAAVNILRTPRQDSAEFRPLLLTAVGFMLLTTFVSVNYDTILLYLALMPAGIVDQLLRSPGRPAPLSERAVETAGLSLTMPRTGHA
jgi:hypothetical protein